MKTVLIVIDGAEAEKIAGTISAELEGYQTLIRRAESFVGTDLLPAHIFFLGCDAPRPGSFAAVDQLLQHINLPGRPCGVFSTDSKALEYLAGLVKACDAVSGEPLLIQEGAAGSAGIGKWARGIVKNVAGK